MSCKVEGRWERKAGAGVSLPQVEADKASHSSCPPATPQIFSRTNTNHHILPQFGLTLYYFFVLKNKEKVIIVLPCVSATLHMVRNAHFMPENAH